MGIFCNTQPCLPEHSTLPHFLNPDSGFFLKMIISHLLSRLTTLPHTLLGIESKIWGKKRKRSKERQFYIFPSSKLSPTCTSRHIHVLFFPFSMVYQRLTPPPVLGIPIWFTYQRFCAYRSPLIWNHFLSFFWIIIIRI